MVKRHFVEIRYRMTFRLSGSRAHHSASLSPSSRSLHPHTSTAQQNLYALHILAIYTRTIRYLPSPYFRHQHPSSNIALIYSIILSSCLNHLNTFWFTLLTSLTLSIRDTPTKLLKHFIGRTFIFLLLVRLGYPMHLHHPAPLVQLLYHTKTSHLPQSYIAKQVAHLSVLPTLCTPHSFSVQIRSHPPSAATCDPRYLIKTINFFRRFAIKSHIYSTHIYMHWAAHNFFLTFLIN